MEEEENLGHWLLVLLFIIVSKWGFTCNKIEIFIKIF